MADDSPQKWDNVVADPGAGSPRKETDTLVSPPARQERPDPSPRELASASPGEPDKNTVATDPFAALRVLSEEELIALFS